ncbi:acyltransferase family protein [Flavobacterium tructae]|uniref:acyltransferase family protein n=1 Tax=Flavobacterium tructae TaxID=1114873 RepID=UPI0035A8DFEC
MINNALKLNPKTNKYSFIEGLRGFAILLVFGVHFFGKFQKEDYFLSEDSVFEPIIKFLHSGHVGVDCFFLISSFLIYKSLTNPNNKISFIQFMYKRYSRLLPVIVFILIIPFIIYNGFHLKVILDNIFFLNIFNSSSSIVVVTWSLVYEIYFYILAGILYITLPNKITTSIIFLLLIFTSILLIHFFIEQHIIGEPVRFLGFFFGVFLAKYHEKINRSKVLFKYKELIVIAGFSIIFFQMYGWLNFNWVTSVTTDKLYSALFYITVQMGFFLIILGNLIKGNKLEFLLVNGFMQLLGMVSYSFYVIHCFVITKLNLTSKLTMYLNISSFISMIIEYMVSFSFAVLLSIYIYEYLEKPYFNKIKK